MKKRTACVWCGKFVTVPAGHDLLDPTKEIVCSKSCAKNEFAFRKFFSDQHIWQKYLEKTGVDVEALEKKHGKNPS
jgi:hypothetical protein